MRTRQTADAARPTVEDDDLREKYRKVNTSQLLRILKQYDLNQSEMADILCVSPGAVSNWMRSGGCDGAMARLVHMTFGGDIVYAEIRREIARLGARRYQRRIEAADAFVERKRAEKDAYDVVEDASYSC